VQSIVSRAWIRKSMEVPEGDLEKDWLKLTISRVF